MDADNRKARIAKRVQRDPHAPLYHFIAPEGGCWPFDPNGALFWRGRYHLFYIFQDPELPHGGHCWGHASTADLVHWDYHPTALAPRDGDPDAGIFSGGAFVNKDGVPTIIYHGIEAGTCIATSIEDDLVHWTKSPNNPVIPVPKEGDTGFGVYNVFDPHAWVDGDDYYAILGGNIKPNDMRDTAYLFRSKDLIEWEYLRPFYSPRAEWTGEEEDCACPDFFDLGGRYVLMCISHPRGTRYYLGRMEDGAFVPEEHHRMNWAGGSCFASESLLDDKGRRLFWAWVVDQRRTNKEGRRALGVMTLPRVLCLAEDGSLRIEPAVELESLRRGHQRLDNLSVSSGTETPLDAVSGECLELYLDVEVPSHGRFTLKVRCSPDDEEETAITYDGAAGALEIDTSRSSLSSDVFRTDIVVGSKGEPRDVPVQEAPFSLRAGELLRLRVFLDRSIVEVFANGRQCVTQRIYPTLSESVGVSLESDGGTSTVIRLDGWEMAAPNEGVES